VTLAGPMAYLGSLGLLAGELVAPALVAAFLLGGLASYAMGRLGSPTCDRSVSSLSRASTGERSRPSATRPRQ
jgi:membrane protein DedA with SNARE-associated domain